MSARRIAIGASVALAVGLLVSCGQTEQETKSAAVQITGAGATFPAPLYKKWIDIYHKKHPDVALTYDAVGSGEGTKRFMRTEVDFGASDAAMSDEQINKVERGVKLIPATAGIIVLAYNLKGITGPLKLPRDVYVDIFMGKIKTWDDPRILKANPKLDLPSREIVLVTRLDSSGTTFAFTNHLSSVSSEWRDRGPGVGKLMNWPTRPMVARGNEGVAAKIKVSERSIGYVEYGYADRGGLQMAWLENKAGGFIKPLPNSGQAALTEMQSEMPSNLRMFLPDPPGESSYPLVTYSWILLYGAYPDTEKGAAVKQFVKWGITEGQQYSDLFGYCRLPQRVSGLGGNAIGEIK